MNQTSEDFEKEYNKLEYTKIDRPINFEEYSKELKRLNTEQGFQLEKLQNYIKEFLNSKIEKRSICNTGTDYEYNYDGYCIKVFISDDEVTEDTQIQLEKTVVKSIENHYRKRFYRI